jgi:flagellar biosynthesis/type III secretory pathway protein FliH
MKSGKNFPKVSIEKFKEARESLRTLRTQPGYKEGYERGYKNGYKKGKKDGYDKGYNCAANFYYTPAH